MSASRLYRAAVVAVGAALPASLAAQAAPGAPPLREFRIDASHSTVEFSVPFLGRAVRGRFDDVQGTIVYAPSPSGGPGTSAVTVAIATASVNTGSRHRDEHLRSEDFLDAARFPVVLFRSTGITPRDSTLVMAGTLTLHGVTRPVSIAMRADGPAVDDPHGSQLVHFTGALRIARRDFGILGGSAHNDWFDAVRSATMGDTVSIALEVAGWRTDFARTSRYDAAMARIASEGVAPALARVRAAVAAKPDAAAGIGSEVDQIAAALLHRGRTADALALLRLNAELFPRSAAAHASLARGLEVAGSVAEARAEAAAAVALEAGQTRALEMLRRVP